MEPWEKVDEKIKKLIDNCTALKMAPDLVNKAYVYTTSEREFSQIWTKEDVHDNEPIYYYYRIQIVGLKKNGYDEDANYYFIQNWGAFNTINHRKRSDYLPLRQCQQKFIIQSAERSRNFIFSKIKENDISKEPLPESVQELIAKYIFDIHFLNKMIEEYTFDVKNTISAFIEATAEFKKSQVTSGGVTYPNAIVNTPSNSYPVVRQLLKKEIVCEPTDKENSKSKTFTLMNFYYKQLHTTIKVLDPSSERYKIISKYFTNSQSSRHNYSNFSLKNVFEIERPCDNHRYTENLKNKQLLWHGTSMSNIPSILYEGFRTTKANRGGMFGPGTYFANSVSKSAAYCRTGGEGILLLCEVALGETMMRNSSCNPLNKNGELPDGVNSVHGVGGLTPGLYDSTVIDEDVLVPYGRLENRTNVGSLAHDEFIVYNPAQIKMRYLITCSFGRFV